jgi:signal transduction histidine kinase
MVFEGLLVLLGVLVTLVAGAIVGSVFARRDALIAQQAQELERRNRALNAFAGKVAHDLREPLTAIKMATTIQHQREPGEQATTGLLQRGVARMQGLINDLLSLSRVDVDSGAGQCDPAAVVGQLSGELGARLSDEKASLRLDVEPARVVSSEGLLHQALWNLTDNALRYHRPGARAEVEIEGRESGGQYELRVSDNGTGMSEEEARHVFEPFFRGQQAQEQPGTGLGLAIVKRVVEANGGTASVTSRPGHGTTFVLRLHSIAHEAH